MAQQTQIVRVELYYRRWLKRFPTFTALAKASKPDVLREWSGLGYNSRALRFHHLAKIVSGQFRSRLPSDPVALQHLPGVGRYTAHAVACFAFNAHVPIVDINIKRILTRWSKKITSASEQMQEKDAWDAAERFLPKKHVYDWNQALMDFGAQVCTARNPLCNECVVAASCPSAHAVVFHKKLLKSRSQEPTWKGIPRRIYRGKILKLLLRQSLSVEEITNLVLIHASKKDVTWIGSLVGTMHREGFLSQRNQKYRLAS